MKLSFENIEQVVEDYLLGNLSETDRVQFEEELNSNISLQEELANQKLVQKLMLENEMGSIRTEVSNSIEKLNKAKKVKTGIIATATFLALTATLLLFLSKTKNDTGYKNDAHEPKKIEFDEVNNEVSKEKNTQPANYTDQSNNDHHSPQERMVESENKVTNMDSNFVIKPDLENNNLVSNNTFKTNPDTINRPLIKENTQSEDKNSKEIDCNAFKPQFDVNTESSSKWMNTGKILLELQKDVSVSLIGQEDLGSKDVYDNLSAGSYQLILSKDGCSYETDLIEVEELICEEKQVSSFQINSGDNWIATDLEYSGKLKIYNSRRMLIFEEDFEASDEKIWNGELTDHSLAQAGVYLALYEIENETCEISLTIFD